MDLHSFNFSSPKSPKKSVLWPLIPGMVLLILDINLKYKWKLKRRLTDEKWCKINVAQFNTNDL